jgi:sulfur relay (sulfurtransferase) complex TusBCD TusD component (DsrE family)
MKLGIILNTNIPETVFNALRLANTALGAGHSVNIFLLGPGVEIESIENKKFDVPDVLDKFIKGKGNLYACGTCLKIRQQESGACPVSTMSQLLEIITSSDKVVTFG